MTPALGLAFALASSLAWAALDALRKRLGAEMPAPVLVALFSLGQAPIFATWLVLSGGEIDWGAYWIPGLVTLALNVAANLLFVMSVQRAPLSVTVPFLALTPVFTAAIAVPILDQHPSATELVGIMIVVAGGFAFGSARDARQRAIWREPGVWMMLAVAAMWASTVAIDRAATMAAPPALHALVQTAGVGVVLSTYLWLTRGGGAFAAARPHWRGLALAVGSAAAAFGLQLVALQGLDAAHIETQKRVIGLVMALLLGRWLFKEPLTRRKALGVLILALGTVVVAWGAGARLAS